MPTEALEQAVTGEVLVLRLPFIEEERYMILDQKEMMKKAEAAFADFCKAMKERIGSEFDKKDLPIFRNVFCNGYMKALDDLVKMSKPNMN